MEQKPAIGLYFHVPFCLSKCPYCDFYSIKYNSDTACRYTGALCRAIEQSPFAGRAVDTIYLGGGTPVLLGVENLARILETAARHFALQNPEITLEANPAATLANDLPGLRGAGFNRISFGVQSGVDAELASLGRLHTAAEAERSILAAEQAGFDNISADLMLGIPLQTVESMQKSVAFLAKLPLRHISAYLLKIEEKTPFALRHTEPDEDLAARLYLACVRALSQYGFAQYEISNFAKNGFVSRHNLKYWRCEEYLGFGPSAHSFMDGKRFYCPRGLAAYLDAEKPHDLAVLDGEGGGFDEYVMLRLRLCEGLCLKQTATLYGVDTSYLAEKARALERNRLLTAENGIIALTPQGFLLSNAVTAQLLY